MPSVKFKNGSGWFSVTNSGLKASESTYGVAKVATLTEVESGTSDDTFVTPLKVKNIFYEKNHQVLHYDWIGTLAEYTTQYEGGVIQPNWVCFITDDTVEEGITWGNILGTLTAQTDLIEYMNTNYAKYPTQTGNAGKFLKTDGSTVSWDNAQPTMVYWD